MRGLADLTDWLEYGPYLFVLCVLMASSMTGLLLWAWTWGPRPQWQKHSRGKQAKKKLFDRELNPGLCRAGPGEGLTRQYTSHYTIEDVHDLDEGA